MEKFVYGIGPLFLLLWMDSCYNYTMEQNRSAKLSKTVQELEIKNKELEKQLSVCCVVKKEENDSVKEESMRQQDSPKINVATVDEKSSVKEVF